MAVLVPGSSEAWGMHLTAHPWKCRGWSRRLTPHHGRLHLQRRHPRHLHARQAVSVSAAAVQACGCISCLSCQVRMQEYELKLLDHMCKLCSSKLHKQADTDLEASAHLQRRGMVALLH